MTVGCEHLVSELRVFQEAYAAYAEADGKVAAEEATSAAAWVGGKGVGVGVRVRGGRAGCVTSAPTKARGLLWWSS